MRKVNLVVVVYMNQSKLCLTVAVTVVLLTISIRHMYQRIQLNTQCRLRRLAINTISIFNDVGMYYWVDFGTLLGIIREDDIILGDNDVDVCINDDDTSHQLMQGPVKQRVEALGYNMTKESWPAYRITDKSLFVDIYITQRKGDTIVGATGKNSDISHKLVGQPKKHMWNKSHIYVNIPENVHETLVWRYGDDYMVPKPGYKGRDSGNGRVDLYYTQINSRKNQK